nr:LysM peptidoglycan-binding domain-containing protein [Chloroflexota bacterium]
MQYKLRMSLIASLCAILSLCVPWTAAGSWHWSLAQEQTIHIVQEGENLFRLALRYGTTVEAIMAANGLTDQHMLYVGQRLIIPSSARSAATSAAAATTGGTYVVQPGDTALSIAFRYGIGMWELMLANSLFSPHLIHPGLKMVIPGAGGTVPESDPETSETYIARPGDTLSSIAQRFHTTAFALAQSNGISDPSMIRVGQVLQVPRIPSGTPSSASDKQRIIIDLSEQHLYAFQGNQLVYSFICSSGRAPYYTRTGEFKVQSKIPNAYGSAWDIWMPHWLGIYWAGSTENGIHALPIMSNGQTLWAGYLGQPISYGCIVLDTDDAKALYDWAEIGTPVTIRP